MSLLYVSVEHWLLDKADRVPRIVPWQKRGQIVGRARMADCLQEYRGKFTREKPSPMDRDWVLWQVELASHRQYWGKDNDHLFVGIEVPPRVDQPTETSKQRSRVSGSTHQLSTIPGPIYRQENTGLPIRTAAPLDYLPRKPDKDKGDQHVGSEERPRKRIKLEGQDGTPLDAKSSGSEFRDGMKEEAGRVAPSNAVTSDDQVKIFQSTPAETSRTRGNGRDRRRGISRGCYRERRAVWAGEGSGGFGPTDSFTPRSFFGQ